RKDGAARSGRDCHRQRLFSATSAEGLGQCANTDVASRDLQCRGLSRADDSIRQVCAARFGPLKIDVKDVQWKDAFVTIAINDLRGTREAILLDWGGAKRPMLPGSQLPGYTTGATASLAGDQPIAADVQFEIPLDFNGSEGIFFAPFGVQNEATLKSNWADPGFRGAFLPAERSVRPDGFDATWKVSYYGRDYPQSWTSRAGNERFTIQSVSNSSSERSSSPFWMRIVTSSARSNTVCYSWCSFLRRFFYLK